MVPQVNYIICNNMIEEYRMVYYAWGRVETAKKTILCIHGLNRNGRDWDYLAQYLVKYGYYVVAVDIVGRGNSDYLVDFKGYDIPYYVADILRLINTLKLSNVSILGTSMGGLIGMAISAMPNHPIEKLILNDIGAEIEINGLKNIASYSAVQPEFDTFSDAKAYLTSISLDFGDLADSVREFMTLHSVQKNSNGKFELKRDVNLSKALSTNVELDKNLELWDYWDKIKLPTLIFRGERSNILSRKTVDKMKSLNSFTQSVEVANAGHAPFLHLESQALIINNFLEFEEK